jgi:hypothetical protein
MNDLDHRDAAFGTLLRKPLDEAWPAETLTSHCRVTPPVAKWVV